MRERELEPIVIGTKTFEVWHGCIMVRDGVTEKGKPGRYRLRMATPQEAEEYKRSNNIR